jgi:hypothetical protein
MVKAPGTVIMTLSCFVVMARGMRMMLLPTAYGVRPLSWTWRCFLCLGARSALAGNNGTPTSEKSFLYDNHFFPLSKTERSPDRGASRSTVDVLPLSTIFGLRIFRRQGQEPAFLEANLTEIA